MVPFPLASAVFELPVPDGLAHAATVNPASTTHAATADVLGLVIGGTSPSLEVVSGLAS